jgi:biopolymer transport protein ExbB
MDEPMMTGPFQKATQSALLVAVLVLPAAGAALPAAEAIPEAPAAGGVQDRRRAAILAEGETLWSMLGKGGVCTALILLSAVVGLAFFFERLIKLRRAKHIPANFDKELVMAVDTRGVDAGLALCLERTSSLARVLYAALLHYGTSRQDMLTAVKDETARLRYDLRRNSRVIRVMAHSAPLWGLLGALLGLIAVLGRFAAGEVPEGAAGLAVSAAAALLPAAWGLLVAVPLYLACSYTKGKADDLARDIEERATDSIVTLDRKARRSIRQIEDIEENLETKTMAAAKSPPADLDSQFEDRDLEKAIKTSVNTPPQLVVPQETPQAGKTPSSDKLDAPTPSQPAPPAGTERR